MKHAQYYRNIANGIARIAQAVKLCDLAPVPAGSYFSERFKKDNPYSCTIDVSHLDPDSLQALKDIAKAQEDLYNHPDEDIHNFIKGLKFYAN